LSQKNGKIVRESQQRLHAASEDNDAGNPLYISLLYRIHKTKDTRDSNSIYASVLRARTYKLARSTATVAWRNMYHHIWGHFCLSISSDESSRKLAEVLSPLRVDVANNSAKQNCAKYARIARTRSGLSYVLVCYFVTLSSTMSHPITRFFVLGPMRLSLLILTTSFKK